MEMNWSCWFRCESSFGLFLVPTQPGIYVLAEEMDAPLEASSRRMLAVLEIEESFDLLLSLSRLFAVGSRWRERLSESRCFVRYAVVHDPWERGAATTALKNWLAVQPDAAVQLPEQEPLEVEPREAATVSERAVERLARTAEYEKVFPVRV